MPARDSGRIAIADADDQTVYFHRVDDKYEQLAQTLPKEKKEEIEETEEEKTKDSPKESAP